VLSILHVVSN